MLWGMEEAYGKVHCPIFCTMECLGSILGFLTSVGEGTKWALRGHRTSGLIWVYKDYLGGGRGLVSYCITYGCQIDTVGGSSSNSLAPTIPFYNLETVGLVSPLVSPVIVPTFDFACALFTPGI